MVHDLLLLRQRLLDGALHLGGVQQHLPHGQDVEQRVKLLDVARVPAQEALGGLLRGEEDLPRDLALGLAACKKQRLWHLWPRLLSRWGGSRWGNELMQMALVVVQMTLVVVQLACITGHRRLRRAGARRRRELEQWATSAVNY